MSTSALQIYLNDHLGLLTGEVELALRVERENEGTPLGEFLQSYAASCKRGRPVLKALIEECGGKASGPKQMAAWLLEKLGRLKPNDARSGYTDLARVLELEMLLSLGQFRLALFETLFRLELQPAGSPSIDWSGQCAATREQLESLREFHDDAVRRAFCQVEPSQDQSPSEPVPIAPQGEA